MLSLLQLYSHTLPSFAGQSERLNAFSLFFSGETGAKSIDSENWEYDVGGQPQLSHIAVATWRATRDPIPIKGAAATRANIIMSPAKACRQK